MENVFLLVLWFAVCVGGAGAGLILLDHYLERRRDHEKAEWILNQAVPAAEHMTLEVMDAIVDKTMKKSMELTKKMYGMDDLDEDDEPEEADEKFKKTFNELDGLDDEEIVI